MKGMCQRLTLKCKSLWPYSMEIFFLLDMFDINTCSGTMQWSCVCVRYLITSQGKMCLIGYQLPLSFIQEREKHGIHASFHLTKPAIPQNQYVESGTVSVLSSSLVLLTFCSS